MSNKNPDNTPNHTLEKTTKPRTYLIDKLDHMNITQQQSESFIDAVQEFSYDEINSLEKDNPQIIWKLKKKEELDVNGIYFVRGNQTLTLFTFAAGYGKIEVMKALLLLGANVDGIPGTIKPVCLASENGNLEALDLLYENKYNIESFNEDTHDSPVHYALRNENIDCFKKLYEHGCPLNIKNKKGITPTDIALSFGKKYKKIVDILRTFQPISDQIKGAIYANDISFLKQLWTRDWNDPDIIMYGNVIFTPLSYAVYCNQQLICKWLISIGANIDYLENKSNTSIIGSYCPPVHVAIMQNNATMLDILAANGAILDEADAKDNITPAYYAGSHGFYECLKVLDKYNVPLFCFDKNGDSNLNIAVERGYSKCIGLILAWVVNENFKDITQAIIDGDLELALENYNTIKNACIKIKLLKIHQIYEQKYSKTVDVINKYKEFLTAKKEPSETDISVSIPSSPSVSTLSTCSPASSVSLPNSPSISTPSTSPKKKRKKKRNKKSTEKQENASNSTVQNQQEGKNEICIVCQKNTNEISIFHQDGEQHSCICFDCMINFKLNNIIECPLCKKDIVLYGEPMVPYTPSF